MSGLVGYIGHRAAAPVILDALSRLEYRGYDSAGLAAISDGNLQLFRTLGRPAALAEKIRSRSVPGNTGIGHTRWASHGRPAIRNAHPQVAGSTAVVHNGIIENAAELRQSLLKRKIRFRSQTDTEILPHLINSKWAGSLLDSVIKSLRELEGGLTSIIMSAKDPDQLVVVKKGNPMVIGLGGGEYIAASDATAIAPYAENMVFLRDGEIAILSHEGARFLDFAGKPVEHTPQKVTWNPVMAEKRGYRHFLLKEIVESPRAVRETVSTCLPAKGEKPAPMEMSFPAKPPENVNRLIFLGSGTSYFAAMLGQWICTSLAGIAASREVSSEFRYGQGVVDRKALYVPISQSGETLDTVESARRAREGGARLLAVTNNPSSSLARISDDVFVTRAGPEISVASSKTFSAIVTALALLGLYLGGRRGNLPPAEQERLAGELRLLPERMEQVITYETSLRRMAEKYAGNSSFFFVGRGLHYPVAVYSALMMKQVANVHAEGLLAGETKHGPISLIEPGTPVMFFANQESLSGQILNDMDELRARGASMIATGFDTDPGIASHCDSFMAVPRTPDVLAPLLAIVPAQLFIYYVALYRKKDIDRPRNIAKSVTV